MKFSLLIIAFLGHTIVYSQLIPDTNFVSSTEIYIKQQLDDSTLLIKKINKNENTYKLTYFSLKDSLWCERGYNLMKNGKTITTKECDVFGNGIVRNYWEDGNVKEICELTNHKNTGSYYKFYQNGILEIQGKYIEFLKNGEWISYTDKGDIKTIDNYIVRNFNTLESNQYSNDELNSFQYGGTTNNELVSLKNGVFITYLDGKIETSIEYVDGKIKYKISK